jgi:hypothetical protein
MRTKGFAATAAAVLGLALASMPVADASPDFSVNGRYLVTSDGQFAKTNEVFMKEATKVETWTLSSTCTTAHECTGEVVSDKGWSSPMRYHINAWFIDRELPDWQVCPDGTRSKGTQRLTFQGIDRTGMNVRGTDLMAGYDRTQGEGGACGRNMPTVIIMPLTLVRL